MKRKERKAIEAKIKSLHAEEELLYAEVSWKIGQLQIQQEALQITMNLGGGK